MKKTPASMSAKQRRKALLGGISVDRFLKQYWQKQPLLIRAAIPDFPGLLSPEELAGLACEDDVQSRLVSLVRGRWQMESGAFDEARFSRLPQRNWTLLVQEVNHHLAEAAALLGQFDFIPYARLDDLMVSYAPDGGGVGPHFDSYDVFLLQGQGKRLWRVSQQTDLTLVEGAPLRILKNFQTEQEYLLEAGDMLYLPPHVAHWGIAVGDCMTYSIGFRAPAAQELASQFLGYMQEHTSLAGMYCDPELSKQKHPARIGDDMVRQVAAMLKKISWNDRDIVDFLGGYLTEPKPHIVFDPPRKLGLAAFHKRLQSQGIGLHAKSQMLFRGNNFYMNGELHMAAGESVALRRLADRRYLGAGNFPELVLVEKLHEWYLAGYLVFLRG